MGIDWQQLYASNQAQIRAAFSRAGIPEPSLSAVLADRLSVLPVPGRHLDHLGVVDRGGLGALVHVPSSLDPTEPAPLVCMLHGCTQDPSTFAAATMMNDLADRHRFVVVYPGQARGRNALGCWNWFLPEHQRRGCGEPEAIAEIVRDLIEDDPRFTIDPERVFVAGLSSGAAMAVILAVCYPELFAAVAVHSGLPYRSATDVSSAFRVMSHGPANPEDSVHASNGPCSRLVRIIVIHGTADRTVAPINAKAVLRQSMTAHHIAAPSTSKHDVERPTRSWRSRANGGYSYTRSQWADRTGTVMHELVEVDDLGHAWSGGAPGGSYTDPRGPSASAMISEFFALTTAPAYALAP